MTLLPEALRKSVPLQVGVLAAILASHIIPSLVIGFGYVIPGSCIDGINPHTLGYIACLVGFVPTFVAGVVLAYRCGAAAAMPRV